MTASNGHDPEALRSISRRYARLAASAAGQVDLIDILTELRARGVEGDLGTFLDGFLWRHDLTGRYSAARLRDVSPVVAEWAADAMALGAADLDVSLAIWRAKAEGSKQDRMAASPARRHA